MSSAPPPPSASGPAQASVSGVARQLPPGARFPGPLVRSELTYLGAAVLGAPKRPLGVALGGSKVKDKIGVIAALIGKADVIAVGGRMAFTFLAARGVAVGATQVEAAWLDRCREMEAAAQAAGVNLLLPTDCLVSADLETSADLFTAPLTVACCTSDAPCVPEGHFGVDIGPKSRRAFAEALGKCGTILWNGPMGKYEVPEFAAGTAAMVEAVAEANAAGAVVVVAGGDSVAALNAAKAKWGAHPANAGRPAVEVTHVSTGGGASLQLLEGKGMPGLQALLPP